MQRPISCGSYPFANVFSVKNLLTSTENITTSKLTFFDFADEHLEALEAEKKINRHSTDSAWLSYIEKYCKARHLTFQEVDERFLKKFKICGI